MNLNDLLKQFKTIEPDPAFTATSKRAILATEPAAPLWNARRVIFRIVETGVAVALAGFFVLLITGTLSGSRISSVQYSAIDPTSLHAEAQAIDMQIELAQLQYAEPTAAASTMRTAATPNVMGVKGTGTATSSTIAESSSTSAGALASTTASSTLSIDQALQGLSN
jgi:hypothetical protein